MRKRGRAITTLCSFARPTRFATAAALSVFLAASVHPQGAPLDGATMKDLAEKGTLIRSFRQGEAPSYLPGTSEGASFAEEAAAFRPTIAVEVVRLIPAAQARLRGDSGSLFLLNTLCAVSTMKGITYWSRSRNTERVLFSESYAVDSPQSLNKIPDPAFSSLPADLTFYSVQEDSSFGRNTYGTTLSRGAGGLRVRTENLTPVSFLFVTVIPKGGLVTLSLIMPTDDGVLFYGIAMLRSSFPLGDLKARSESLANRVVAVADWLKGRLGP